MFEDYQIKVIEAYRKKKEDGSISKNLINPTTANLKKECLRVYDERYTVGDDDILSMFFNVDKINNDFRNNIVDVDPGSFRALSNHLKGSKAKTHERNSELLAWLIDFKPRPSFLYYKKPNVLEKDTNEPKIKVEHDVKEDNNQEEVKVLENDFIVNNLTKTRNIVIAISICCVLLMCLFFLWKDRKDRETISANEKCMYWNVDHFEAVSCNKEINATKISLDLKRLQTFKRITEPDTLTKNSLGKVWYVKINGNREYYTGSGLHPTRLDKKLNPLSDYILNKYSSYYRYLFKMLIYTFCVSVGAIVLGVFSYRIWKNQNTKNKKALNISA